MARLTPEEQANVDAGLTTDGRPIEPCPHLVVLCEDWCGLAVDHDGPCRSTPSPKEVSIEIVVSTLWREHAEEQDRRHRPVTPESFVDYLVIQGWLDASLVYPEED